MDSEPITGNSKVLRLGLRGFLNNLNLNEIVKPLEQKDRLKLRETFIIREIMVNPPIRIV